MIQYRHFRPEPPKELRKLKTDRAPAHHRKPFRKRGEVNSLAIRDKSRLTQSGNVGDMRNGSGGNQNFFGADHFVSHTDFVRGLEGGTSGKVRGTEFGETRIFGTLAGNGFHHAVFVAHGVRKIRFNHLRVNPEFMGATHEMPDFGGAYHRLCGNTPRPEALTSEFTFFR